MLLSYGAFLFYAYLSLACRRGQNKYPPLPRGINIYSSCCRGRYSKDCFPTGPFFFALNYPSRCRGRNSKDCFPLGLSFFVLNYPWPVGADKINIPRWRGG